MPCTAGFLFETLAMGAQLNPSGEFDPALQPSKDGTPNGTVRHGNVWVEYARPLVSLIMACINIGVTESINSSITDRLVCWVVGMTSPGGSPAPTSMRSSMITASASTRSPPSSITEMNLERKLSLRKFLLTMLFPYLTGTLHRHHLNTAFCQQSATLPHCPQPCAT